MSEQRTEAWFEARKGKITASRVADMMATTKSGYAASRKNYMVELAIEILGGDQGERFVSAPMQRGIDLEPVARACYEIETGEDVTETGFIVHPDLDRIGASPDGLVGKAGLVEIKCPNTAQHLDCLISGKPDAKYLLQMQCQMACTGRQWCDFYSFDDRLPDSLQSFRARVARDDEVITAMME